MTASSAKTMAFSGAQIAATRIQSAAIRMTGGDVVKRPGNLVSAKTARSARIKPKTADNKMARFAMSRALEIEFMAMALATRACAAVAKLSRMVALKIHNCRHSS